MKSYSIGRDLKCDIIINDSTDVISRRHAILNVQPSGKMTIIDQSSNGTYVNGIRISPNVSVPVSRKDTISFAHIAKLDWDLVPKSNVYKNYILGTSIGVILIMCIIFGFIWLDRDKKAEKISIPKTEQTDSISQKNKEKDKEQVKDKETEEDKKAKETKKEKTVEKKNTNSSKQTRKEDNNKGKDQTKKDIKKPTRVIG